MFFDIYVICLLFICGIIFGFLMVLLGIKAPLKDKKYVNVCDNCNVPYKWYEMIPVISFFVNRGECLYCHHKLSLLYPILEIVSGILFAFSYVIYGFSYEMIIMLILTLLSILIYVSDFKYFVILDKPIVFISIIVLILKYLFFGLETLIISFCSGFLIFLFMMIIKCFGDKLFKQESLGGGDVKLSVFFGFLLGIKLSIVSLIIGSLLAFPYAIYCSLTDERREIPFGPFLITGLYLTFIFMEPIRNFLLIIF